MVKGFTLLIGLAVVVALALAAVFGSMSLANPAMAAIGQPADAELTERTFNADSHTTLTAYLGRADTIDLAEYISGMGVTHVGVSAVSPVATRLGITGSDGSTPLATAVNIDHDDDADTAAIPVNPVEINSDNEAEVVVLPANNTQSSMATITLYAMDGDTADDLVDTVDPVELTFDIMASRAAAAKTASADLGLMLYTGHTKTVNLLDHFNDGVGAGAIQSITLPSTTGAAFNDQADGGTADSPTRDSGTDLVIEATGMGMDRKVEVTFTGLANAADAAAYEIIATQTGNPDGSNGTATALAATTINITVGASTPLTKMGNIAPRTVTIGTPDMFDASMYFDEGVGTGSISGYSAVSDAQTIVFASADGEGMVTLTGFSSGAAVVTVTAMDDGGNMQSHEFVVTVEAPTTVVTPPDAFKPSIELSSTSPGKNASYTFKFNASKAYSPGFDHIIIQLSDGDFQVPEVISTSDVSIKAGNKIAAPADISVDDTEITLVLGDMDGDADGIQGIAMGENVTVAFRTAAGIKNPEEGGDYDAGDDNEDLVIDGQVLPAITIKRTISLSEDAGGRGDEIMVTGKGFKNGTSVTFLRMKDAGLKAADFAEGVSLCSGLASDGVATCSFTVTSPLFKHGDNYINGVDGRSNKGTESEPFDLEPSISVNPSEGSPGESLLVQLYDFGPGATVEAIRIARRTLCSPDDGGAVSLMAECGTGYSPVQPSGLSFRVVIPNDAPLGRQDLQIKTTDGDDNTNITISGPLVTSTPSTVLANQRVSLVGNGFTPSSTIKSITFAGTAIDSGRINDGLAVRIDGGGNWNASVNLPLNTSTVSAGVHTVQIEDMGGRKGGVKVTVPERSVTITPSSGRVGTIAVVRGDNFPSRNEEGNSFNVQIVYGSGDSSSTTVSTVPDASGRFEAQMRIPTTSAIPSTNDVSVSFGTAQNGGPWTVNVSHDVPEGVINLSSTSGSPGSALTISGEGFRSFVPVSSVMIGSIDITPTPRPSSDVNGMVSFDVVVPGLDVGIQTIEVQVGKTTASAGFTVTESGVNPGDITAVAAAVEPLGDNLVSVWNFNNDTKVWSFYDPTLAEGNTLTHMITGETYLIRIKADQEVILNRDTRSLTCVGGNCWNQVVW